MENNGKHLRNDDNELSSELESDITSEGNKINDSVEGSDVSSSDLGLPNSEVNDEDLNLDFNFSDDLRSGIFATEKIEDTVKISDKQNEKPKSDTNIDVKKKKHSVEVVEDDRPLWEKNPEKYRKKKPLFVRMLGGLWAFIFFWILCCCNLIIIC